MTDSNPRLLWLALVLLLPSVCLHQMVPHHHAEPAHTHDHDVPEPIAQLPHSHDEDRGDPYHHCQLTEHLDSHDFAKPGRELDQDDPALVAEIADGTTVQSVWAVVPDLKGPVPGSLPDAPGAPRAPPLLG